MSVPLRQVDAVSRPDHYYLEDSDSVFYLREYTSRRGWSHGETNQLICNLKKPMGRVGLPDWVYKSRAITQCARELRAAVQADATWVPVPPSKAKSDSLYDDRLCQILRKAFPQGDIRELVTQPVSTAASHTTGQSKPLPSQLAANYTIDASLGQPKSAVIVFDDILTTGSHFKAMQLKLAQTFPRAEIYGLVIARRVFPDDEPSLR